MTPKHLVEQQLREERKQLYLALPTLADRFPKVQECIVELRFSDPAQKATPSPYKRIFVPEMRVHFDFKCPLRNCTDGGFDFSDQLLRALEDRTAECTGTLACAGKRKQEGLKDHRCGLEVQYRIMVHRKEKRATR